MPKHAKKKGKKVKRCEVCYHKAGMTDRSRFGEQEPMSPLGAIKKCEHCLRLACPDCSCELECCELSHDDETGESTGWGFKTQRGDWIACTSHQGASVMALGTKLSPVRITPIAPRRSKK